MRIFVAGASGAIGQPLIKQLLEQGHEVTAMTRSTARAQKLIQLGASTIQVNVMEPSAVEEALRRARAEIVIDELTSLPKNPSAMKDARAGDYKIRIEGGGNLYRAALACGVRRYIQQSSGFFLQAGPGLADESVDLITEASPGIAASAKMYTELEARVRSSAQMEGIILRHGFFYGPNTWYHPDGGAAENARQRLTPVIGQGQGIWSFIHVEDAAQATVAALTAEAGTYNIVDNQPSPMRIWLPAFARAVGAPEPEHISEEEALAQSGQDAVYYATQLRGASNAKTRTLLHFKPRPLEWLHTE